MPTDPDGPLKRVSADRLRVWVSPNGGFVTVDDAGTWDRDATARGVLARA